MSVTDHATAWTALEAVSETLTSSNESADLRILRWGKEEWAYWYHQLLNQIHALAAGSLIEYITSSVRDSKIEGDDVYAFTANLVIHAQVSDFTDAGGRQNATVRTTAWSRTGLTELTVIDLNPYPVEDTGTGIAFPHNLTLELRYGQRPAIRSPHSRRSRSNAVEHLYPSLLADLTRETA